jgi:transmembrane sensor
MSMNEKDLNKTVKNWDVQFKYTEEEAWEKLSLRNRNAATKVVSMRRSYVSWVAAASIAMVAFAAWFAFSSDEVRVVAAQRMDYVLPDGSVVRLNEGSELIYDASEWKAERALSLAGEAMFEVKKGSTFTVHTSQGDVSVLGTSFNIYAENNQFHVDCYTGKVRVASNNKELFLTRGLATKLRDGNLAEPFEFNADAPAWLSGELVFVNADLTRVITELEKKHQIRVTLNLKDASREISGDFTNFTASDAISLIASAMGLKAEGDQSTGFTLSDN